VPELLLLLRGVDLEKVDFVSEAGLVCLGARGGHMSCHGAGLETTDAKSLHLGFFSKLLLLLLRQSRNLFHIDRPTLKAWASIDVELEPALDVPLNFLTKPAFKKATAHLKADNLVLVLHKVVIDRDVSRLVDSIKKVTLDHMTCVVPLFLLPDQLTPLKAVVHHFFVGSIVVVPVGALGYLGVHTLRSAVKAK